MRLLAAINGAVRLCLVLAISACAQEPRAMPTAPTVPSSPTPTAPTFTLSGVITERLSGRPVQGAKVWVEPSSLSAQVRSWPPASLRTTPSDEAGRYTVAGLPLAGQVWVSTAQTWGNAFNAPYMHQCVTTVTIAGDATLDLTITSTTDLVALNASTGPAPLNSRIVSGTVFRITGGERQPAANVWVGFEASGSGDLMAETRTDPAGHYRLCGLPREQITLSAAIAYGNVVYASVAPGADVTSDIEIGR
jgi:hypothetical protein